MKLKTRTNQPVEGDELENLKLSGDLEVAEGSEVKVFENIVDKDGHKRFIEGDIEINEISGVTKTYGKWSLSGSHLLIIVALDIAENTTISSGALSQLNIPQWIIDKIVPLYANSIVDNKIFSAYTDNYNAQQMNASIQKFSSSNVFIYLPTFTTTASRHVRISFDLLIDNE